MGNMRVVRKEGDGMHRRQCVDHVKALFGVSERRACRVLGHPRSTQRYEPSPMDDGKALTEEIVALAELMVFRGVPDHIRSDNGPEFTTRAVREWLGRVGARTLYIEPWSPWENGYIESFNGKLDDLLDKEVFYTFLEVHELTERYRRTTTGSDRTALWATGRRRLRPSCLPTLSPCLSD